MKTRIYEVADEDLLDTFFGEDAKPMPVSSLGQDHGELIYEGKLGHQFTDGDVIVLNNAFTGGQDEYVVLLRVYFPEDNQVHLVVHRRHFEAGGAS